MSTTPQDVAIELGDLTPRDIGSRVSIRRVDSQIVGFLTDFRIETYWIDVVSFGENPDDSEPMPGKRTVSITIGPWSTDRLALDTPVEVRR